MGISAKILIFESTNFHHFSSQSTYILIDNILQHIKNILLPIKKVIILIHSQQISIIVFAVVIFLYLTI